MQRKLRRFIPEFLQKIDQDWMLNKPFLWATKIHYVLFFSLIALVGSVLFAFIQPIRISEIPMTGSFLILVSLPALMALGYWWYRLSTVFSEYSHEPNIWRRNLSLILLGSLMMMAVPTSGWFILEWRAMEVRAEMDRVQDSKALAKGLFLFESKLSINEFYAYRKGVNPTYSWLHKFSEGHLRKEFDNSDPMMVAQEFLTVAHRYRPHSFPTTAQRLVEGYELSYFPASFNADALWEWRQDITQQLNYWENMGPLNPYILRADMSHASFDWKALRAILVLLIIPFLGLGMSLVYLGLRPFIGLVLSLVSLVGLISILSQFMTYRVEIGESFYGVAAIISFFAMFFGFSKPNARTWQRDAQQIALMIGLFGIYGLLIFAPSILFNGPDEAPSVPIIASVLLGMLGLWLGPIRTRINFLQTTPSAL